MGEVRCVASWSLEKEKKLREWVIAGQDRYVIWAVKDVTISHPRMFQVSEENELSYPLLLKSLIYLPFHYEDLFNPQLQKLAFYEKQLHLESSDFKDLGRSLLSNYKYHLNSLFSRAQDCFGLFDKYPAVICGAGPSLKEAAPFLKQHQDRCLIIAAGAALIALEKMGIRPHLSVQVDADPHHTFEKTSVPLFYELRTAHRVCKQMKGDRFLMAGTSSWPLQEWIERQLMLQPTAGGGWSASTRAVQLAMDLGCPSIYLAGLDFCFEGHQSYAKGVSAASNQEWIEYPASNQKIVKTCLDWVLAAEWINMCSIKQGAQTSIFTLQKNFLMPAVELAPTSIIGAEGATLFTQNLFKSMKKESGSSVWKEIQTSFQNIQTLIHAFLAQMQKIFPSSPMQDSICRAVLDKIEKDWVVRGVLDPVWNYWENVFKRQPQDHPDALILHKILLLKSIIDPLYAVS